MEHILDHILVLNSVKYLAHVPLISAGDLNTFVFHNVPLQLALFVFVLEFPAQTGIRPARCPSALSRSSTQAPPLPTLAFKHRFRRLTFQANTLSAGVIGLLLGLLLALLRNHPLLLQACLLVAAR